MPRWADDNVLVGFDTADDAGVYKLTPELALVQTVDFFTPIVDDPYTYGAIAAANSLSDVYAMGGRPISSLTVLAWPAKRIRGTWKKSSRGRGENARSRLHDLGGHSVVDDEIKFGYAVPARFIPRALRPTPARAPATLSSSRSASAPA